MSEINESMRNDLDDCNVALKQKFAEEEEVLRKEK